VVGASRSTTPRRLVQRRLDRRPHEQAPPGSIAAGPARARRSGTDGCRPGSVQHVLELGSAVTDRPNPARREVRGPRRARPALVARVLPGDAVEQVHVLAGRKSGGAEVAQPPEVEAGGPPSGGCRAASRLDVAPPVGGTVIQRLAIVGAEGAVRDGRPGAAVTGRTTDTTISGHRCRKSGLDRSVTSVVSSPSGRRPAGRSSRA